MTPAAAAPSVTSRSQTITRERYESRHSPDPVPRNQRPGKTECPVPLGKAVFDRLEPVAGGRVRVVKRVEAQGGFGPLLKLFAPRMRRDIADSLVALERRLSE